MYVVEPGFDPMFSDAQSILWQVKHAGERDRDREGERCIHNVDLLWKTVKVKQRSKLDAANTE